MSRSQDTSEGAAAHNTPREVGGTQGPDNAASTTESELPDFFWMHPAGLLEEELEKRKKRYNDEEKADAWKKTARVVQRYSDEMIERWNKEIDTYLVFAGLFSAVLTAFNVQSYLLLQPASPDPTLLALQQISLQLSSFSTGPPPAFVNSTHPAFQQGSTPPSPIPRAAVWLNILWFSSLILSLSSASIGMMAKQWLNEYASGISSESGSSRQTARLRQYRLNNLKKWRVGDIVNTIPVLLQVSVALFLAGLLVLLWTLHPAVATVASIIAGLLGAFTAFTVLLPSIKTGCAYLSPQSLTFYRVFRRGPSLIKVSLKRISGPLRAHLLGRPQIMRISTRKLASALWKWNPVKAPTWHGIEQSMISEESQSLDADIISAAYDTAMNPDLLATAAICLSELEPSIHVVNCVERLQQIDESHFGISPSPYVCAVVSTTGPVIYDLWADSLLCHCTSEVQQIMSRRRTGWHPISDLDDRLSFHFRAVQLHPSGLEQEAVGRILLGLWLVGRLVEEMSTDMSLLHRTFSSSRVILLRYNGGKLKTSPKNVRYAASAAHQQMYEDPSSDIQDLPRFCTYSAAALLMLECVLASQDNAQDDHQAILSSANRGLRRLMGALQPVDFDEIFTRHGQYWIQWVVWHVSALVNIVTEEPTFPVETLLPQDCVSTLERVIVAIQGAISRHSVYEDMCLFRNRTGGEETLQDKLDRLRAIRSRSGSAPQEAPPSTSNLPPISSLVSVLGEASVISQSTSYYSVSESGEPHHPSPRASSDHSVLDELQASTRSSTPYYSTSDSPEQSLQDV